MSARLGAFQCFRPVVLMAAAGALVGLGVSWFDLIPGLRLPPEPTYYIPLPHQVPKYPGGVAMRFAMVHDVIHERYPRHGKAYYEERNRLALKALVKEKPAPGSKPSQRYRELLDDLGAGLDSLGAYDEAVSVLRGKLAEEAAGLTGRDLYTTYANLGTFLIHGSMGKAQRGDAAARERVREGLAFLHKSIEVNPAAHFGREIWQALTTEYLLAAIVDPKLLLRYDLAGNSLGGMLNAHKHRASSASGPGFTNLEDALKLDHDINREIKTARGGEQAARLRELITHLDSVKSWKGQGEREYAKVAFDEPVLGIVGMWRLGSGANAHFALMLGETMQRVGQRRLAWCAYERTARLAERFWPDPGIQEKFVAHCREQQNWLEGGLQEWADTLRPRFEAELAYGLRYQETQHRYEEERIKAGASLEDPHFYDAFHARHGKIASPPGGADVMVVEVPSRLALLPGIMLFAGLFAFGTALGLWSRKGRTSQQPADSLRTRSQG